MPSSRSRFHRGGHAFGNFVCDLEDHDFVLQGAYGFAYRRAVRVDVNASVRRGDVVVLCGPSGSGRSTLIRTMNRLEESSAGFIHLNGESVPGEKVDINRVRSHIGFVFQQVFGDRKRVLRPQLGA